MSWDDSEKGVEAGMIAWLQLQGYYARKVHSGALMVLRGQSMYKVQLAPEGTPDIFACIKGRFVTIEVKKNQEEYEEWDRQWRKYQETGIARKSYRRSLAQHFDQESIRASDGITITCSSLEELQKDIQEILTLPPLA